MVIITTKKRIFITSITSLFIILTGFSLYRCTEGTEAAFWSSANIEKNIEIFDISKGIVEKTVPVNATELTEAKGILKGITGIYLKVNALPEKGHIIKIPFEPNIMVKNIQ